MAKEFEYEGEKYQIDASRRIDNGGDIDPNTKTILVDKDIPEKFHEGIAVHEIEERKYLLKGHTYVYSHNEAQKKELEFYEKVYGKDKGLQILEEEEAVILTITRRHSTPKKTKILKEEAPTLAESEVGVPTPDINSQGVGKEIEMRTIQEITFEGKRYIVDHTERLIGTLVDVYENGKIIYIDRDVPERFFEGLALNELVTRKFLKKNMGWSDAHSEADKFEKDYYAAKYGPAEAAEIFNDEMKFQAWKFEQEKKELKEEGGHKVIYEKDEILPK
jgi:hypothetical protein